MDGARLFSDLMVQVVAESGGDGDRVMPLFQARLHALPPEQRKRVAELLDRVTRFEEPQRPFEEN